MLEVDADYNELLVDLRENIDIEHFLHLEITLLLYSETPFILQENIQADYVEVSDRNMFLNFVYIEDIYHAIR
jgi:hypothetical protein